MSKVSCKEYRANKIFMEFRLTRLVTVWALLIEAMIFEYSATDFLI